MVAERKMTSIYIQYQHGTVKPGMAPMKLHHGAVAMDCQGVSDFNDAPTVGAMTNNELHAQNFHFCI